MAIQPSRKDCMTNKSDSLEDLLTEHEVAKLLKVSVATMRRRRLFRQPPDFVKIGASVRYRRSAIERLIEAPNNIWGDGNVYRGSQIAAFGHQYRPSRPDRDQAGDLPVVSTRRCRRGPHPEDARWRRRRVFRRLS